MNTCKNRFVINRSGVRARVGTIFTFKFKMLCDWCVADVAIVAMCGSSCCRFVCAFDDTRCIWPMLQPGP
jgi:hypothetical protein